ncbi:MAG: phospho-sugar mutase [Myxococcaceae bacterium]
MTRSELRDAVEGWLAGDPDPATRAELQELVRGERLAELAERFAQPVAFGTAGLRALLGAGPSRMNRAVVRCATAGLAHWLLRTVPEARRRGVVVARDGRHLSVEFAAETAGVLAAAGIPVWAFTGGTPTPLAAFAVTSLGAAAGVVVTASHNPKGYNGYKVYGPNGAQVIPPDDAAIAAAMAGAGPANAVPRLPEDVARAQGLLREVGPQVRARYLEAVLAECRHPGRGRDLVLCYTALHGVGGALAVEALRRAGFEQVHVVAEQQLPNPDFPTVSSPNPEEPAALTRARAVAEAVRADLVLANDPDADRLAVMVRAPGGGFRQLTGDDVGVLLGHYLLTEGLRPVHALVLATVVSSAQLAHIARRLGVRYAETLTGFKWIANAALREAESGAHLVFAYEEALGYAVGPAVHDKDGIGAAVAMADMAGWAHARGATVLDLLDELAREYGVYASLQRSITLPGAAGVTTLGRVMEGFRRQPPSSIAGRAVVAERDYQRGRRTGQGQATELGLPKSNLLGYELAGGGRVLLRPSGTEPKLKLYVEVSEAPGAAEPLEAVRARASAAAAALADSLLQLAQQRGLEPGPAGDST